MIAHNAITTIPPTANPHNAAKVSSERRKIEKAITSKLRKCRNNSIIGESGALIHQRKSSINGVELRMLREAEMRNCLVNVSPDYSHVFLKFSRIFRLMVFQV